MKNKVALAKWKKEVLPKLELKVMEFPQRMKIQDMFTSEAEVTVCAEAACQGLTGKWINELDGDDLPIFRQYSDSQIMLIGGRVIDVSGNPGSD